MLQCYDLYDLHAVFVNIRSCPDYPLNESVLNKILSVLNDQENNHDINQIRKAIQPLLLLDDKGIYQFANTENKYSYFPHPTIKDNNIYDFLIIVCQALLQAVKKSTNEQITDMADCFHNLPIQITENKNMIPLRFWKNEVKCYRKKWDKQFLMGEEKMFKKNCKF